MKQTKLESDNTLCASSKR